MHQDGIGNMFDMNELTGTKEGKKEEEGKKSELVCVFFLT